MTTTQSFWEAVKAGDAARVAELAKSQPDLASARTEAGVSAVLLATYYRHASVAEALIAAGAALDIFDASATGRAERVSEWLTTDPSLLNAYAPDGFMPLGLAAFFGRKDAFDVLLAAGAEVNQTANNATRVRPLHAALAQGDPEAAYPMAAALLAAGAQVNAAQEGGWTPLHEAARHGYLALTELLLAHGADPNQASDNGTGALALAMNGGHTEVAEALREAGAV